MYIIIGRVRNFSSVLTEITEEKSELKPNFQQLQELYKLEHGMFPKMAYKLWKFIMLPEVPYEYASNEPSTNSHSWI